MVCLHGFTGSWRVWELVLGHLERHHDTLEPTLARFTEWQKTFRALTGPTRSCARPRAGNG